MEEFLFFLTLSDDRINGIVWKPGWRLLKRELKTFEEQLVYNSQRGIRLVKGI